HAYLVEVEHASIDVELSGRVGEAPEGIAEDGHALAGLHATQCDATVVQPAPRRVQRRRGAKVQRAGDPTAGGEAAEVRVLTIQVTVRPRVSGGSPPRPARPRGLCGRPPRRTPAARPPATPSRRAHPRPPPPPGARAAGRTRRLRASDRSPRRPGAG